MKGKFLLSSAAALLLMAGNAIADQGAVSMLNELRRGELSAVETYDQALEKVGTVPGAEKLKSFRDGHAAAAEKLGGLVVKMGGTPSEGSGPWGAWAKTVTGSAKLLGDEAALKALKEGEEHGIKEYQEALENENVPAEVKTLISEKLLPAQRKHIDGINALMQNV